MECSTTNHAPRFLPEVHEAPPAPRWRLLSWSVGVGTLLLAVSVVVASLAVHSPSRADEPAGSNGQSHLRAVAIAFVDIEDGIRNLYPIQSGRVVALPVKEGVEVSEGTPLLKIDDSLPSLKQQQAQIALDCARERLAQAKQLLKQHKLQIKAAKAVVDAAKSKKAAAQAQADKAERFDRERRMGSSAEDVNAAKGLVREAEAGIRAAQAKLEAMEAMEPEAAVRLADLDVKAKEKQLDEAKLGVKECTVLAPCKGKVLRTLARIGEVLGSNPKQPALEFCPAGERIVRAEVEQEFAYQVSIGQKARITDDARSNSAEWTGSVKRISDWYTQRRSPVQEPMQFNDVRTMEVIIRLDGDGKGALRIGQRVRVELEEKK
jgi:multidrug resistance efflux pump